jgi:hypothetical protein
MFKAFIQEWLPVSLRIWFQVLFSLLLNDFFYFMKHSWTVFESSIDKDKDVLIRKYKPEAMCKIYVVMIYVL